jgi:type IV pilus assembly protein PilO
MSFLSDFRNLDYNRVGSWPSTVKYTAAFVLAAVIVAAVWWFKVRTQQDELKQLEAKEQELFLTLDTKQQKVANLDALKAQLEEMKEILRQMLRQLPGKTEMPDLLVDISQTALSTGIDNQKFQPGAETVKEFYAETPITLRMVGTYHQFGSFVSGVASLPRVVILTMHDISLKPQGKAPAAGKEALEPGTLVLEGTVKTYRYVDESESPDGAASTPAKGATPTPAQPAGGKT